MRRISVTHKFITKVSIFKRGIIYSFNEIRNLVIMNGWYRNDTSIRGAIRQSIIMKRIITAGRGKYIFV